MDTLTELSIKGKVVQAILYHIELFESFEKVYLFGSIINENKIPNDIDLLLIYKKLSNGLLNDLNEISATFEQSYGFQFDLTVLSENEEDESDFISRLNSKYIRLK